MTNSIIRALTLGLATCFVGISVAQAVVITPVGAVASNRFFNNAQDDPANLLGPGLTELDPIETSTHDNSNWNALPNTGWFADERVDANPTVDFDLGGTFTVEKAHIWNWNGSTDVVNWGVMEFSLTYSEDAIFGNGDDTTQAGLILNPASGLLSYTGEHYAVASVPDVTNVRFTVVSHQPNGNFIVGLSEVRFSGTAGGAVPEPSTIILATLGLLSLGMTRRRRRR